MEKKESDEWRLEFLRGLGKQLGQLLEQNMIAFHAAEPMAKAVIPLFILERCQSSPRNILEKPEIHLFSMKECSLNVDIFAGNANWYE